jgi:hypothetical protein
MEYVVQLKDQCLHKEVRYVLRIFPEEKSIKERDGISQEGRIPAETGQRVDNGGQKSLNSRQA